MQKLLLLGAAVIALAAGYTALWNSNAGHLKLDTENSIIKLKNHIHPHPEVIQYSSIETSGYPGNINVTLNDLHLGIKPRVIDLGNFNIQRGIFSNSFTSNLKKVVVSADPFPGEEKPFKYSLNEKGDSYSRLTFKGNQFANFISNNLSMNPLQDKELSWETVKEFQSFIAKSFGAELIEENSKEVLLRYGPSHLNLNSEPVDEINHLVTLEWSAIDTEFTPAFDKETKRISQTLAKAFQVDMSTLEHLNLSAAGKKNSEFSATYKGPIDPSHYGRNDLHFDLNIAKFKSSDLLQTSDLSGRFAVGVDKEKLVDDVAMDFKGTYLVTPALKQYFKTMYTNVAKTVLDIPLEKRAAIQDYEMQALLAKVFIKHADSIIPDLSKLGAINYVVNFNADPKNLNAQINELSYENEKYGFNIKGHGNFENPQLPRTSLTMTFNNYEALFTDLFDYTSNINTIVKEETKGVYGIKFDQETQVKLIDFLNSVGTKSDPASKNLTIDISIEGNHIKVGQLEGHEALMKLMPIFM